MLIDNKERLTTFLYNEWLILLLIVLLFLGFNLYLGLLLIPIVLLKIRITNHTDILFWGIVAFSLLYSSLTTIYGLNTESKSNTLFYALYPPVFYVLGRYLTEKWENYLHFIFFIIVFGFSFSALSEILIDIKINGFLSVTRGLDLNFGKDLSATGYGLKLSLGVAVIGVIISPAKNFKEKTYKYLLIIISVLSIIGTIHLINRTGLVIAFVSILFLLIKNFKSISKTKLYILFTVLIVFVIVFILPMLESLNVLDSYLDREDVDGYEASSAGGRTERWIEGINVLFSNPLGGGFFKDGVRFYAHNLWIDTGEMVGLIPTIILIFISVIFLKQSYRLIFRNENESSFVKSLLLTMNLGFLLTCMVEPIIEANFTYLCGYFFFWGITSVLFRRIKELE